MRPNSANCGPSITNPHGWTVVLDLPRVPLTSHFKAITAIGPNWADITFPTDAYL